MTKSNHDPKVKIALTNYLSLDTDQKRFFQEGALNPSQFEIEPGQIATWEDIDAQLGPIEWAWKPWLPMGMLTILAGESGAGKSALALRLAACFILGWDWPDGTKFDGEIGSVLWCEAEAAQAIHLDRAKKWGIPLDQVYSPLKSALDDLKLDNADHMAALYEKAFNPDVRFIVIDSLKGANSRDENSSAMIDILMDIAALGRDSGKPFMVTHHLRKRSLFDADGVDLERLRGSSAIVQAARLVWALDTPDAQAKESIRIQAVKSNLAKFPEPVGMFINDLGVHFMDAPEAPRIETVGDRAADLLLSLLAKEPLPYSEIVSEIEQAGISIPTANRAKKKLGIVSVRKDDRWIWSLPSKETNVN